MERIEPIRGRPPRAEPIPRVDRSDDRADAEREQRERRERRGAPRTPVAPPVAEDDDGRPHIDVQA